LDIYHYWRNKKKIYCGDEKCNWLLRSPKQWCIYWVVLPLHLDGLSGLVYSWCPKFPLKYHVENNMRVKLTANTMGRSKSRKDVSVILFGEEEEV
jgi:hypothetical protein